MSHPSKHPIISLCIHACAYARIYVRMYVSMYAKSISTNFVKSGKSDAGTRNKNQDEFMAKMVYVYICNMYIDIYIYKYVYDCLCMCEPLSNLIVFGRFKGIASWGSLSVVWGRFLNKWVSPVKLISLPALTQRCMKELQVRTQLIPLLV